MTIFEEYKQTRDAIDILTAELVELKPKLIEKLKNSEGSIDIKDASFSLRSTKIYEFSKTVKILDNNVKIAKTKFKKEMSETIKKIAETKKQEIKGGIATIKSESFTPVMRVIKKQNE